MARRKRGRRKTVWRWARRLAVVLVCIAMVPVVLVPVYRVMDPVSVPMIVRTLMLKPVDRQWRDIDRVSDRLKASVIMSEDGQFCRHWGVDVTALQNEVEDWLAGRPARGASTLTMQVARNLFLWNARSAVRKALEVPLAIYIDLVLPKRRIMEIYLNIAEWGPNGEFGVEAGAQKAFGMDADAFTWAQAALMTVALPNPHVRLPARPGAGLRQVAGIIEGRARAVSGARIGCLYRGGERPEPG